MVKNPPPPTGHYHPKFNEIDLNVHHKNIFYGVRGQTSRKITEKLGDKQWEMNVIPNKLPNKVYSFFHIYTILIN
jgi:hypothetical protein